MPLEVLLGLITLSTLQGWTHMNCTQQAKQRALTCDKASWAKPGFVSGRSIGIFWVKPVGCRA